MYNPQHKTTKTSANYSHTPAQNQFSTRHFVVQPQAEQQTSQTDYTEDLPTQSKFPSISIFSPGSATPPPPRVQTQLTIGQPTDTYEQEAEIVAEEVLQKINSPQVYGLSHQQHSAQENWGISRSNSQILHREIDPTQVKDGATKINPQDINLERIGHGLIYHDALTDEDKVWLREQGFEEQWFPDGNVTNAGSGLNYGLLLPSPAGLTLGKNPVLAFRGTSDLATAWQDLDINSPGHGGIQQILTGFAASYLNGIVAQFGKLDVTGHSLGGALAQHFVGTHPNLVKRLVTFQSAAPNAKQYQKNIEALPEDARPEIVHHIAKGDIVDLVGGEHLKGTFFEHDLETSGLASVSTLARVKQAHTSQLLNTEDIVGAGGQGRHAQNIKVTENATRPYTKSRLVEAGRMMALNKGTFAAGSLLAGAAGLAGTAVEVPTRLAYKGLAATGSAIANGASSLYHSMTNFFSKGEKKSK